MILQFIKDGKIMEYTDDSEIRKISGHICATQDILQSFIEGLTIKADGGEYKLLQD